MAQYAFDPNDHPVGALPTGWAEYGYSGRAKIQNDATLGNYLQVLNYNTASFDTLVAWDALGVLGSVDLPLELICKLTWLNSDVVKPGVAWADVNTWNGYKVDLSERNEIVELWRYDNGSGTRLLNPGTDDAQIQGELWWIRWHIDAAGNHRVKAWKDGTSEPATWKIDFVDSTYQSGKIGFEIQRFGQARYFWLGIGTSGDAAPVPSQGNVITVDGALIQDSILCSAVSHPLIDGTLSSQLGALQLSTQANPLIHLLSNLALTALQAQSSAAPVIRADGTFSTSPTTLSSSLGVLIVAQLSTQAGALTVVGQLGDLAVITADAQLQPGAIQLQSQLAPVIQGDLSLTLKALELAARAESLQDLAAALTLSGFNVQLQGQTIIATQGTLALQFVQASAQAEAILSLAGLLRTAELTAAAQSVPLIVTDSNLQLGTLTLLAISGDVRRLGTLLARLRSELEAHPILAPTFQLNIRLTD